MAAITAKMQRDRKAVRRTGLEDRPVTLASQRLQSARRNVHLCETPIAGALLDFGDRGLFMLDVHLNRRLQAWVRIAPARKLPFVHRGRHRRTELDVPLTTSTTDQ